MSSARKLPASVNRAVFVALLIYFGLLGYAVVGNQPLALLVAEIVFGLIAIGIGTLLFQQARDVRSLLAVAGGCLIAGGLLQFGYLLTARGLLNDISSFVVFIGVGLYIYAVFSD
ncbi:hypothetical protein G6M89_11830 [Natronolimnobius sp. AArcel1]|uniref:hypothetical protein n=1 Tax=Natronolimnobius sp. AArcel1 TaxID=1679093 RepID=UPI0013ED2D89|nr:hypothetical protein [Natronolimnobius sp. AArcel1]NGM69688.1 hypothetical protein [Natronolimnobius sp. AArcel1]